MAKFVGKLERRLEMYAVAHLNDRAIRDAHGVIDLRLILKQIYENEGMSMAAIARMCHVTDSAVYQLFRRFRIVTRFATKAKFQACLEHHGYASAKDFFVANMDKEFQEMATMLGVTPTTISRHYNRVIRRGEQ